MLSWRWHADPDTSWVPSACQTHLSSTQLAESICLLGGLGWMSGSLGVTCYLTQVSGLSHLVSIRGNVPNLDMAWVMGTWLHSLKILT